MLISEKIARMIEEMLDDCGGILELQRNDLATKIGCVPSQINYVISSRFSQNHGYMVESRRGGGGYIRITRINVDDKSKFLMHFLGAVGDLLDQSTARVFTTALYENELISAREFKIISSLMTDKALEDIEDRYQRDAARAKMMKTVLLNLV